MFELAWLEYQGRDVVFVGVAVSDRETDAREFAEKSGVTYAVGVDTTGKIMKDYDVVGLPTTFFIDRRGIVKRKLTNAANEVVLRLFLGGQLEDG